MSRQPGQLRSGQRSLAEEPGGDKEGDAGPSYGVTRFHDKARHLGFDPEFFFQQDAPGSSDHGANDRQGDDDISL